MPVLSGSERLIDELGGDPQGTQLRADAHRTLAARRMGGDEGFGKACVIERALCEELADDGLGHLVRKALPGEPGAQLGRGEVTPREQPQCRRARGRDVALALPLRRQAVLA